MNPRLLATSLAAAGLLLAAAPYALAQEEAAPIYGRQLMTEEELEKHRARMHALETDEERAALRNQHRKEMQARARERNVELPSVAAPKGPAGAGAAPDQGFVRGRDLMTKEEREKHRQEMRSKGSAEEREQLRREKHEEMKERARKQGKQLPDQPLPRGSHGGRGGADPQGPRHGGRH